jgi:hypothetical protein
MKRKVLVSVAALSLFGAFPVKADEILTYRAPAFDSGNYLTATVDLRCGTCEGATFSFSTEISSITISAFSSTGVMLDTISAPSSGVTTPGVADFISISSAGDVTSWFLDLQSAGIQLIMATTGDAGLFGTANLYQSASHPQEFNQDAGTWSASPVPGPLVGAGLPGLMMATAGALFGWWRRRHSALLAA